jgi:surfactin synthase thioesterase subunit
VLASAELRDLLLPVLRADFGMSDRYSYRPGPLLRCPITAFGGSVDPAVTWDSILAWRECTTGRFAAHRLPGDHFFPRTARAQFLAAIGTVLRAHHVPGGQR